MFTSLRITTVGAVPGSSQFGEEQFRGMLTNAWRAVGEKWHRDFRPKHFTVEGGKAYGYLPRSGDLRTPGSKAFFRSYQGRKFAKFGHTKPLVWSGTSEQQTATGTSIEPRVDGVRIVMNAPHLEFRNPRSQIDMQDELTRVTAPERAELAEVHNREMDRQLREFGGSETKTFS